MSGILGINDWEKELEAGRNHIAKLLNEGMAEELQPGAACTHTSTCSHPPACKFEHNGELFCSSCGNQLSKKLGRTL